MLDENLEKLSSGGDMSIDINFDKEEGFEIPVKSDVQPDKFADEVLLLEEEILNRLKVSKAKLEKGEITPDENLGEFQVILNGLNIKKAEIIEKLKSMTDPADRERIEKYINMIKKIIDKVNEEFKQVACSPQVKEIKLGTGIGSETDLN
jgi:hypothetical protein